MFLQYDQQCLNAVFKVFDHLEENIGFKINYDKTTIYRIGSLAGTDTKLYTDKQVKWTNEPINVLGVFVSDDVNALME